MSLKKAVEMIRRNNKFLIATHSNMDGDAIGAQMAFYLLLKKLKKTSVMFTDEPVPEEYSFLPGLAAIKRFRMNMPAPEFDCFVALDCSDLKRTGQVQSLNGGNKQVLNIDHHISNAGFGKVNWVEPEAACSCQMVYRLYKEMRVRIDKSEALFLYVGLLTDTGSFRYSNTDPSTHLMAAELISRGIDVAGVYKHIYGSIPLEDLKLLTVILPKMRTMNDGKVIWFDIPGVLLKKHRNISFDLSESILSFGRTLKGVEVVALFKENLKSSGEVRVNFRSQGKIDVNKIAGYFGGGGHKTASGATVKGPMDEIKRKVLNKIKSALADANLI
ncbi:MAG: bifunctional oligoribonuclease/PAP phosphatase NrnA [Candidatus Omnitrophica bacterium]|jgi:phosphoesterase RecJ-like protein|nr:bifunctional oligoribonuclease/PAP phosphatase NrnA [Candidatus Omnitrophota bacterium]MDD5078779.1 bifunctional oligoribonuclease/PAP phosphatase NrnA [Candidatus Omnitrophota bacterium]